MLMEPRPQLIRRCGVQQLGCSSTILGNIRSWDLVAGVAQTAHGCLKNIRQLIHILHCIAVLQREIHFWACEQDGGFLSKAENGKRISSPWTPKWWNALGWYSRWCWMADPLQQIDCAEQPTKRHQYSEFFFIEVATRKTDICSLS